jgi:hypothetical protein
MEMSIFLNLRKHFFHPKSPHKTLSRKPAPIPAILAKHFYALISELKKNPQKPPKTAKTRESAKKTHINPKSNH